MPGSRKFQVPSPKSPSPKAQVGVSRRHERIALAPEDDRVRALLLMEVEPLAVVAANAFGLQDLRPLDRAPLARLLADLARVALGTALDAEDGEVRHDPEHRADGAEEAAVEIAHEYG